MALVVILYHTPGSCSLASLVALAESGLEYEVRTVDANNRDEIARINPWGRVPALVLGSGTVLTETVAILFHVADRVRSEEHTSELQSLMRISYAVFCLKKKKQTQNT